MYCGAFLLCMYIDNHYENSGKITTRYLWNKESYTNWLNVQKRKKQTKILLQEIISPSCDSMGSIVIWLIILAWDEWKHVCAVGIHIWKGVSEHIILPTKCAYWVGPTYLFTYLLV